MFAWAGVQALWKQTFQEYVEGEDAMAGRTKCSNCSCTTACLNKQQPSEVSETPTKKVSSLKGQGGFNE